MKLFSRKALVAGATAVALSFAGTSAAVAAEPAKSSVSDLFSGSSSFSDKKNEDTTKEDPKKTEENGSSDMDPKDITAWISVFTAVIGALGALFSFASKHLGFKL